MQRLSEFIRAKPSIFVIVTITYLIIIGLVKWFNHPQLSAIWFIIGGILGIYFLDASEHFFSLHPSPFRTILFTSVFSLISFFVVTSSSSMIAVGLVLSMYLGLLMQQIGELEAVGNLASWYRVIAGNIDSNMQRWILAGFAALFVFETFLFIT